MTDKIFEQELKGFDYSVFSKVRNSLLEEILQKQRRDNMANFASLSQRLSAEMMSDDGSRRNHCSIRRKNFSANNLSSK